jgi:hypothetical protein
LPGGEAFLVIKEFGFRGEYHQRSPVSEELRFRRRLDPAEINSEEIRFIWKQGRMRAGD